MSLTESYMLPLGTIAPEFHLPNTVDKRIYNLSELKGLKGSLIIFMCNHCPLCNSFNRTFSQNC